MLEDVVKVMSKVDDLDSVAVEKTFFTAKHQCYNYARLMLHVLSVLLSTCDTYYPRHCRLHQLQMI